MRKFSIKPKKLKKPKKIKMVKEKKMAPYGIGTDMGQSPNY